MKKIKNFSEFERKQIEQLINLENENNYQKFQDNCVSFMYKLPSMKQR